MERKCGECTGCCEGWLADTVWGRAMYPGKSCYFLKNKKCSIYELRPNNPCRNFYCSWVKDNNNEFPDWLRPDKSGIIMADRETPSGTKYIAITECNKENKNDIKSWIKKYQLKTNKNITTYFDGHLEHYGTLEFCSEQSKITGV